MDSTYSNITTIFLILMTWIRFGYGEKLQNEFIQNARDDLDKYLKDHGLVINAELCKESHGSIDPTNTNPQAEITKEFSIFKKCQNDFHSTVGNGVILTTLIYDDSGKDLSKSPPNACVWKESRVACMFQTKFKKRINYALFKLSADDYRRPIISDDWIKAPYFWSKPGPQNKILFLSTLACDPPGLRIIEESRHEL